MKQHITWPNRVWEHTSTDKDGRKLYSSREVTVDDVLRRIRVEGELYPQNIPPSLLDDSIRRNNTEDSDDV